MVHICNKIGDCVVPYPEKIQAKIGIFFQNAKTGFL